MAIGELINKLLPFFDKKESSSSDKYFGVGEQGEKVDYILHEYNNVVDFETENLQRNEEAWALYSGFNDGQWPKEIVAQLHKEGRNPFQANFIRQKVDGLTGSLIKNFFDVNFEAVDSNNIDQIRMIKDLMYIDKELMDWNAAYLDLVTDGLVHQGVEEIFISDRYSPLGNIGFRRLIPGHILFDPDWLSNNSWDLKRAWKTAYLRPRDIKQIYESKGEEIDNFIKMKKGIPSNFDNGDRTKSVPHSDLADNYTDKYRVIEFHHIEREKKKIEIVVSNGLVVPDGPDEFKREWAILNQVDMSDGVMERDEYVDVSYVTTICPSISKYLVLEDKKSRIQLGRLPFFPWSSARINGRNSGLPELLKNIQQTYNKRESMVDHIIASSANGAAAIDPNIVDGDEHQMETIKQNWNTSGYRFWTSPGALASGREFVKQLPTSSVDYSVLNEITRMVDLFDRVSKSPAAMDARSEGSEESGILFARKELRAEIALTKIYKGLEQHWNEKGEAYLILAKQLYSGVYRELNIPGRKGEKLELNKPTLTPSGEVIENDISQLPRMKVIVTQSPEGATQKAVDRAVNVEILRSIGPDNPISRARAVKNIMKTLDTDKQDRDEAEQDATLELELNRSRLMTEMLQLKATQMQIQMQMQQAMQPQIPGIEQLPEGGGEPEQGAGNPAQSIGNESAMMSQNQAV